MTEAESHSVELFRQEGVEFRSVHLNLEADGSLKLDLHDIGPTAKRMWGRDYEAWIRIKPDAMTRLAFVLLWDRFTGRQDAVDELRGLRPVVRRDKR